jgi:hypothetical protein
MFSPKTTFDYHAISTADRQWLFEQTGVIRNLARSAAGSIIEIGKKLQEARKRMPHTFTPWVQAEFTFGLATAYKWMRVASTIGDRVKDLPIDASALYMLATKAKPELVESVIQIAEGGKRVTPALIRSLTKPESQETVTPKKYKAVRKSLDQETKASKDTTKDPAAAWAAFAELASKHDRVTISRIKDSSGNENSCGGVEDHERSTVSTYLVTALGDGLSTGTATSVDLEVAILKISGHEPKRQCSQCKRVGGLYTLFSRKESNDEGRCTRCKHCERSRIKESKAAMETRQRKAQGRPTPKPEQDPEGD